MTITAIAARQAIPPRTVNPTFQVIGRRNRVTPV
jgi:hypothetical protein